jgi:acetylglutamate kinase
MHIMNKCASPLTPGGTLLVKFGGNAMSAESEAALLAEVAELWISGVRVVVVHGGGPQIDAELAAKGIATRRIDGLRVTDAATLAVTEAVLCATINKRLVRTLLHLRVRAVGISGQDGALLVCERQEPGFVGKITHVNAAVLSALLDAGFLPVIAPLGIAADGSTAYNVNGDTAAGAIAGALKADAFVLVTNVERVRRDPDDPSSGIERMTLGEARGFATSQACRQSMQPKIDAVIAALDAGSAAAYITSPRPLAAVFAGNGTIFTHLA